jgi:hypothetical protein
MAARPPSPTNAAPDSLSPWTAADPADGGPVLGGRFVLGALAGRGGMGAVYHAWDRVRGTPCAVKVLADALAHDEELRARFRREAEAVMRLDHERIVRVHACGETGSRQFIAMEYVPGGTLRQLLADRGPLPERPALRIALEIAEALAYAHERGIVHRDVKPQNVLLTVDGHAKVADFGIARTADATRLTRTGSVFGSTHYIAPEQVRGDAAGTAADQYALGVVLYEALAGRVPFDGEVPVAIALRHVHDPVPNLAAVRPDVSQPTLEIVARLLAKAPAGRYPSAEAAAEALRGALGALPDGPGQEEPADTAVPSREPDTQQAQTHGLVAAPDDAGETQARPAATDTRRGRRGRVAAASMWAAGIVAAVAASVALAAGYRGAWLAAHTTVPVLTGLTMQQAAREAVPLQLGVIVTGQRQDPHLPVGAIVDQDPPAGQQVLKGVVVQLTVSEGSGTVPDLRGIPVSGAARVLEGAGLRLGAVTYAHDNQVAAGYVMSQAQRAGTHLPANGGVDVVVSAGPNQPPAGVPQAPVPESGSANK